MEQEATVSWRVDKLRHQLESTRHESQDWVAKAMGARVVEMRALERATATKQKLDAMKVLFVETEVALRESLEALEAEQKARFDAEQEVVVLCEKMLGAEESNTRLLERVTQQEEGLSILKSARLGTYLFYP